MSEKILLKDVEAVYVQWAFGDFKLFDGMSEVSAVGKRHDKDGETYLVHYVGDDKEWRYGIATDELRLERRATPAQPAPSAPAPTVAEGDSGYIPCVGYPVEMFVKGWLASPLNSIYEGKSISVLRSLKDEDTYIVKVGGRLVSSLSEVWFWRTVAEGQMAANTAAQALAATNAGLLAESEKREKMLLAALHNLKMRVFPLVSSDYDRGRQAAYNVTTELVEAALNAHAKMLRTLASGGGE